MCLVLTFSFNAIALQMTIIYFGLTFAIIFIEIPYIFIKIIKEKSLIVITSIHNRINNYIQAKPTIMISFELAQKHKEKQLPDKDYEFSFNYWIDVSRVDEINSLSEYSIVNVEFKVKFENEETKQSYERYVDQLKTDLSTTYGISKNDIITKTTFEMGHQKDGILFGKNLHYIVEYVLKPLPLTRFILPGLFTLVSFPRFKVKKVISLTAMEINTF